jgi:hypothetical protein
MANKGITLRRDLTLYELECLDKLMLRKGHELDRSTAHAGYFLQMKLFGTMTFRILHSHGTWIKVKKALESVGLDIDGLPDWTEHAEAVRGVRWYKDDVLQARDVWSFLVGIDRRKQKDLGQVE